MTAGCTSVDTANSRQTSKSGSTSMRFRRSQVAMSKSWAVRLYSGGLPAVTTIQPSGTAWRPKILYCRNCSMAGVSVSDTQLISSRNKMPSQRPVASIAS